MHKIFRQYDVFLLADLMDDDARYAAIYPAKEGRVETAILLPVPQSPFYGTIRPCKGKGTRVFIY